MSGPAETNYDISFAEDNCNYIWLLLLLKILKYFSLPNAYYTSVITQSEPIDRNNLI